MLPALAGPLSGVRGGVAGMVFEANVREALFLPVGIDV
jgi:hypothetical protein